MCHFYKIVKLEFTLLYRSLTWMTERIYFLQVLITRGPWYFPTFCISILTGSLFCFFISLYIAYAICVKFLCNNVFGWRRKRRKGCFRADVRQEEIQTPPPAKILAEDKSPVLMETETSPQPSSSEVIVANITPIYLFILYRFILGVKHEC